MSTQLIFQFVQPFKCFHSYFPRNLNFFFFSFPILFRSVNVFPSPIELARPFVSHRFYMFSLFRSRRIMYSDLQSIAPEQYMKQITKRITELHAVSVRQFELNLTDYD